MNKFIYFNNVSISVSYKDCDKIEIRNNKTNQTDKNKIKKNCIIDTKIPRIQKYHFFISKVSIRHRHGYFLIDL